MEKLIRKYFPDDYATALAVAKAESGLRANATNWKDSHRGCKGSFGIFQIGCLHEANPEVLYDVEYNIKRAREIYDTVDKDGKPVRWKPWGAYTSKTYLAYMQ